MLNDIQIKCIFPKNYNKLVLHLHFSSSDSFDFLRILQSITTDCCLTAFKRYRN